MGQYPVLVELLDAVMEFLDEDLLLEDQVLATDLLNGS